MDEPQDPGERAVLHPALAAAQELLDADPAEAVRRARAALETDASPQVEYGVAAILIDAADILRRADLADEGVAILDGLAADPVAIAYNKANGLLTSADLSYPDTPAGRLGSAEPRRVARGLLRQAAKDGRNDADRRSQALVNLGNLLDRSGRWLEAYEAYREALDADPTNAMASGNAALALRYAATQPIGDRQRLLALSDALLDHVREHPEEVIRRGGERALAPFLHQQPSGLPPVDETRPSAPLDRFIVGHRLALSFAVEGLPAQRPLDDAVVTTSPPAQAQAGVMLDVLAQDFLAARQVAFGALCDLPGPVATALAAGERPSDLDAVVSADDPKLADSTLWVTSTGDLGGEPVGRLVLAQRAAVDVLDRVAVTFNEILGLGERADRVTFRDVWFPVVSGRRDRTSLRADLVDVPQRWLPVALAELAIDMSADRLYERVQTIRHAATHRLVAITTGCSEQSRPGSALERVPLGRFAAGVVQALQVARAALLYMTVLLAPATSDPLLSRQTGILDPARTDAKAGHPAHPDDV